MACAFYDLSWWMFLVPLKRMYIWLFLVNRSIKCQLGWSWWRALLKSPISLLLFSFCCIHYWERIVGFLYIYLWVYFFSHFYPFLYLEARFLGNTHLSWLHLCLILPYLCEWIFFIKSLFILLFELYFYYYNHSRFYLVLHFPFFYF